jgi:hypothetical protein
LADDIVFVRVDPATRLPVPHGKTLEELETQTQEEMAQLGLGKGI